MIKSRKEQDALVRRHEWDIRAVCTGFGDKASIVRSILILNP